MYSVHVQGKALMRPTTSMNMAGPRIGKSTQESKLPCFLHFICCIMYDVHVGSENLMDIALMVGAICARKWVCWNKAQLGLWKCSCGRRHALRPLLDVWLLQLSMFLNNCIASNRNVRVKHKNLHVFMFFLVKAIFRIDAEVCSWPIKIGLSAGC